MVCSQAEHIIAEASVCPTKYVWAIFKDTTKAVLKDGPHRGWEGDSGTSWSLVVSLDCQELWSRSRY